MLRPILLLSLAAISATSCAHADEPVLSWGKPGVSYDRYRADSVVCALAGAAIPVEQTQEYGEIERGLKTQQRVLEEPSGDQFDQMREYNMTYQRNLRANVDDIQDIMLQRVHICLRSKRYKEFALTPEQLARLGAFPKGTEMRFRYLHAVASDPSSTSPDLPASITPPELTEDVDQ